MTQILKLSKINMLKILLEKVKHMQDQIGNFSRKMKAIRKNQRRYLKLKNNKEAEKN